MVRKLRRKFVITAMSALLIIMIVTIGVINITNLIEITSGADDILTVLVENDGQFPIVNHAEQNNGSSQISGQEPPAFSGDSAERGNDQMQPDRQMPGNYSWNLNLNREREVPFATRFFWVKVDADDSIVGSDCSHIASVSESDAETYALRVISSGRGKGYLSTYRYLIQETAEGETVVIFKDCSIELYNAMIFLRNSFLLMIACLVAMFILVWMMSGMAVSPVVESLEKQKRFITDAGHELKTPLAVISANVDVIELDNGASEWTGSIRNQVGRMNQLVKNMLTLSRMEEENIRVVFADMDLSAAIQETADSFSQVAESEGKKYKVDIQEGIHINGDRNSITQLASLLLDNAIKYSSTNGMISVRLYEDKKIIFEVNNTCDNIPQGNLDKLFDRFYRGDTSRSRKSGGYGIGLSVARAITTTYGGTIEALRDGDSLIRFVVSLPKGGVKAKEAKQ